MIQYMSKNPEQHFRYNKWRTIHAEEWSEVDFIRFNIKINDIVYTCSDTEFNEAYNKAKIWEKLTA